jgi:hypothetical protein
MTVNVDMVSTSFVVDKIFILSHLEFQIFVLSSHILIIKISKFLNNHEWRHALYQSCSA